MEKNLRLTLKKFDAAFKAREREKKKKGERRGPDSPFARAKKKAVLSSVRSFFRDDVILTRCEITDRTYRFLLRLHIARV